MIEDFEIVTSRCSRAIPVSTAGSSPPSLRPTSTVVRAARPRHRCARTCASTLRRPPRSSPAFAPASDVGPTRRPVLRSGTRAPTSPLERCVSSRRAGRPRRRERTGRTSSVTACANSNESSRTRSAPAPSPSLAPNARRPRASSSKRLALAMTDVAFAAGFSSVRQFNDTVQAVYASSPTMLRSRAKGPRAVEASTAIVAATSVSPAPLSRQSLRPPRGDGRAGCRRGTRDDLSTHLATGARSRRRRTHADARVHQLSRRVERHA